MEKNDKMNKNKINYLPLAETKVGAHCKQNHDKFYECASLYLPYSDSIKKKCAKFCEVSILNTDDVICRCCGAILRTSPAHKVREEEVLVSIERQQ